MNIKLNVQELYEVLNLTPIKQNILLVGKHGIGKSEIITDFYSKKKMKVQPFFLGQMSDPGDLIGLMHKDEESGKSVFLPPFWWPRDDEPIVLFLDELNRARPEILQAVQDLTLNRTLAGKTLPKGSIVISAINEGDEYQVTELDPALVSRFNVYYFYPTVKDWIFWARNNEIDERVIDFILQNSIYLDSSPSVDKAGSVWNDSITKTPDRRAWNKVSDFIKDRDIIEEVHIKIIAGIVGIETALIFKKFLSKRLFSPENILFNFSFYKKKIMELNIDDLIYISEKMIYWINSKEYEEKDKKKNRKTKKIIQDNFLAFIELLEDTNMKEVIASIASSLEDKRLSHASSFLLIDSEEIMDKLVDYIENIRL